MEISTIENEANSMSLSNPKFSISNLQSFNDNQFNTSNILKEDIQLPETFFDCQINLLFTSLVTFKNFQLMRNQFLLIFKVKYPEDFFKKIYEKSYFTIFGFDKSSKELASFSVIKIIKDEKKAEILALGVVKEYQNNKIGNKLLN